MYDIHRIAARFESICCALTKVVALLTLFVDNPLCQSTRRRRPKRSFQSGPWSRIPSHMFPRTSSSTPLRFYSSQSDPSPTSKLTHLTPTGSVHMISISDKAVTTRTATSVCTLHFSNATALPLIRSNTLKKGDVLSVARIAGIMAAKKTGDLIPLCHPIAITHVNVDLSPRGSIDSEPKATSAKWAGTGQGDAYPFHSEGKDNGFGTIEISATVQCDGQTGVEMEALTAASTAALTVYDMCKAVDKGMRIEGLRVVRKEGGKSGSWVEGENIGVSKGS